LMGISDVTGFSRLDPPPAGIHRNRWQYCVALWMPGLQRVSIQRWNPSLSSSRDSRHHGSCPLPLTVTWMPIPSPHQPIRTSANTGRSSKPPKEGRRHSVGNFKPRLVHLHSVCWIATSKRNRNVGSISLDDIKRLGARRTDDRHPRNRLRGTRRKSQFKYCSRQFSKAGKGWASAPVCCRAKHPEIFPPG